MKYTLSGTTTNSHRRLVTVEGCNVHARIIGIRPMRSDVMEQNLSFPTVAAAREWAGTWMTVAQRGAHVVGTIAYAWTKVFDEPEKTILVRPFRTAVQAHRWAEIWTMRIRRSVTVTDTMVCARITTAPPSPAFVFESDKVFPTPEDAQQWAKIWVERPLFIDPVSHAVLELAA